MRECIRCHTQMINTKTNKHGDEIRLKSYMRIEGEPQELSLGTNDGFFKDTFHAFAKVAVCPKCGEVSFYIESDKL